MHKTKGILLVAALLTATWSEAQTFNQKVTTVSNVRLAVSNFGIFGNAFDGYRDGTGTPSCEYPANSGIEHLFEGGLWVGGVNQGGLTRVTTTALDASSGYSIGAGGFETVAITPLEERSSLFDSRFYSAGAVSHQDYVATFTDTVIEYPGTNIPVGGTSHQPMGIAVEMASYNWNYNFSDFVIFLNFKVKNVGNETYNNVYIGHWNNTVVRNINITPAGSGGAAFYNKGGNGFMDSLHLSYCYDALGDVGFTESYIGQKFLGASDKNGFHHPDIPQYYNPQTGNFEPETLENTYQAWVFNNFNASFAAPANDNARLLKMQEGLNESPCWTNPQDPNCPGNQDFQALLNDAGNRSDLNSAGPFNDFAPGDEITISFAYVLAEKNEDGNPNGDNNLNQRKNLVEHAVFAQETYNGEDINFNGVLDDGEDLDGDGEITRFVLPTPPDAPRTKAVASENKIEIYWSDNAERTIDPISNEIDFEGYRIYLSKLGFDVAQNSSTTQDYNLVAQYDIDGNGLFFDTGFEAIRLPEAVQFEGDTTTYRYKYTIDGITSGWQYAIAITAFDRGDDERKIESLESSILANDARVYPGTTPVDDLEANQPFVYPNPYYYGAAWEGKSNFQEESRKLIFANLPARCVIRIYTSGGDFIDEIKHDAATYDGSDIRWFRTFGAENPEENVFSGGEHAWDILTSQSQIISRGLYLFTVENLDTGESKSGKFVIIK